MCKYQNAQFTSTGNRQPISCNGTIIKVGNSISGTVLTVHYLNFLAWAGVQSQKSLGKQIAREALPPARCALHLKLEKGFCSLLSSAALFGQKLREELPSSNNTAHFALQRKEGLFLRDFFERLLLRGFCSRSTHHTHDRIQPQDRTTSSYSFFD